MIRRFLGPQPAEKEEEKDKQGAVVTEPIGPAGAPAPPAGNAAPASAGPAAARAAGPPTSAPAAAPAGVPAGAGPNPQPPPARPSPAAQTPVKTKEADVSQRPESLQAVPRVGHAQVSDQTVTVIGNGARLEGNLISAASLRIEGTITGTITAEGDVMLAPEAEVSADIKASNCTLGGRYKGNVNATGTIELTSTARVEGNLTCRSLIVNQGAIFSGQSIMDLGGPKKAAAPAAASAPAGSGSSPKTE